MILDLAVQLDREVPQGLWERKDRKVYQELLVLKAQLGLKVLKEIWECVIQRYLSLFLFFENFYVVNATFALDSLYKSVTLIFKLT